MTTIKTTSNAGHEHTISDANSGYTDVTNGHKHKLATGCSKCRRTARLGSKFTKGRWMTAMAKGHFHYFQFDELEQTTKE